MKLKILTVDRENDDGYWIAGVFNTDEEIAKYMELYLFDDATVEVQEVDYPNEIVPLANGEYAYQVLVVNPKKFVIEHILSPENFQGNSIDDQPKSPLRLFLSAKNAAELKEKCLKMMSEFVSV